MQHLAGVRRTRLRRGWALSAAAPSPRPRRRSDPPTGLGGPAFANSGGCLRQQPCSGNVTRRTAAGILIGKPTALQAGSHNNHYREQVMETHAGENGPAVAPCGAQTRACHRTSLCYGDTRRRVCLTSATRGQRADKDRGSQGLPGVDDRRLFRLTAPTTVRRNPAGCSPSSTAHRGSKPVSSWSASAP